MSFSEFREALVGQQMVNESLMARSLSRMSFSEFREALVGQQEVINPAHIAGFFFRKMASVKIFSGSATNQLALAIADCYGQNLGQVKMQTFSDGEIGSLL